MGIISEDVLIEILSKLSVKSLLRFRCVCKSWYNLVENPSFVSKHQKNEYNTRLIVRYTDSDDDGSDDFYYPKICFSLFLDETLADLSSQDLVPQMPILGVLFGPFDGIFCSFVNNYRIALWNLATKECKALPKCMPIFPQDIEVSCSNVGFGLDLISNNFKLVWVLTLWDEKRNTFYEFTHVGVYNLSTNSWRDFTGFEVSQYNLRDVLDSMYHGGVCYWLAMRDGYGELILSFSLSDEVFQEVEDPCTIEFAPKTLGVYNNYLCLIQLDTSKNCFDAWVMKERHWIKQFTTGPFAEIDRPIGVWKNGAFFIRSNMGQLLLYDPTTQEIRDLELRSSCYSIYYYKESLITLKAKDSLLDCLNMG